MNSPPPKSHHSNNAPKSNVSANHGKMKIYLHLQKYQFQELEISILGPESPTLVFEAVKLF
jgi:hypothetical protein